MALKPPGTLEERERRVRRDIGAFSETIMMRVRSDMEPRETAQMALALAQRLGELAMVTETLVANG